MAGRDSERIYANTKNSIFVEFFVFSTRGVDSGGIPPTAVSGLCWLPMQYTKTENEHDREKPVPRPLMRPLEVSQRLGVSLSTVYRLVDRRALGVVRISGSLRFTTEDVDSYIAVHRMSPRK